MASSKEKRHEYYLKNADKIKKAAREWWAANPEKRRKSRKLWRLKNKDKANGHTRAWYQRNRETERERVRSKNWRWKNLPKPTREMPDKCECCGRDPSVSALHLDHDHKTQEFRGWLCFRCNLGLGLLGDTEEALERALLYLRKPK